MSDITTSICRHCGVPSAAGGILCGTAENRTEICFFIEKISRERDEAVKASIKNKSKAKSLEESLRACWHVANCYDGEYGRALDGVMEIADRGLKAL